MSWMRKIIVAFEGFDWILLTAVLLLLSFGLAALYGIQTGLENHDFLNFKKQIIFAFIGLTLMFFISFFDYLFLRQYAYFLYVLLLAVLVAVLIFGTTFKGTTGWFSYFGFNLQPVEVAKIAIIIFLARYFSDNNQILKTWQFIIVSGLASGIYFFLIVLQPDFGSALLIFIIWFCFLLFSPINKSYLFVILGILLLLFFASWTFFFKDYQKGRILSFINPSSDPYGRGYHVRQAIIAVGSGQILGRGLGAGSQSQLKFIPAIQTDFTFAVIAEELGFFGASLVIFFYTVVFYRIIRIVRRMNDHFAIYLLIGILLLLLSHFIINVGMNVGMLPVTGISLPFISYGGSFLISCMVMIGIVENIAKRRIRFNI